MKLFTTLNGQVYELTPVAGEIACSDARSGGTCDQGVLDAVAAVPTQPRVNSVITDDSLEGLVKHLAKTAHNLRHEVESLKEPQHPHHKQLERRERALAKWEAWEASLRTLLEQTK